MWAKIARKQDMSGAASTAERLVIREETRTRSRMTAYRNVAASVGRSASWLRGLIGGSVKRVDGNVERALDAMLLRALEADIARLEAELAMARQCGLGARDEQVSEVEAHLSRARALLNGAAV